MARSVASLMAAALLLTAPHAAADRAPEPAKPPPEVTFFDHDAAPFWFSGEVNSIFQYKQPMRSPYSGVNSLRGDGEYAISGLFTAFFAYAPFRVTELIADAELAAGGGISQAVGLAGYTNLDVVRNPTLSHEPYLARVQIHQLIPLSRRWVENPERGPLSSFAMVPRHRLELRAGKLGTPDTFDLNPAGSDSHMQFMNWSVDNNGAYDYAADTRGYTYGAVVEYKGPIFEARYGLMLMPKVANGLDVDWDILHSRGDNLELMAKYGPDGWAGALRLTGFWNHANMGSYREAIDAFIGGADPSPDITAHRQPARTKAGFGVNVIQELAGVARLFARGGWNDGKNETFAYTEIDDTVEVGADLAGKRWHRPHDRTGIAFVSNGISELHREYLRLGGLGFLLGDGTLDYARELVIEHYYTAHVWRGAFAAGDVQFISNPGYNHARGPACVLSLRGRLAF